MSLKCSKQKSFLLFKVGGGLKNFTFNRGLNNCILITYIIWKYLWEQCILFLSLLTFCIIKYLNNITIVTNIYKQGVTGLFDKFNNLSSIQYFKLQTIIIFSTQALQS